MRPSNGDNIRVGGRTTDYVAFLRAVNVGGRVVRMDALRRIFEELGFTGVETFIASGNVTFTSSAKDQARLEQRIEKALAAALGFHVATFVRSVSDLVEIARHEPFRDVPAAGASVHVGFLKTRPGPASQKALMAFRSDINDFHVHGREVFWLLRGAWRDAGFSGATLEKAIGGEATLRNVTTVRKLAARCDPG